LFIVGGQITLVFLDIARLGRTDGSAAKAMEQKTSRQMNRDGLTG